MFYVTHISYLKGIVDNGKDGNNIKIFNRSI